MNTLTEYQVDNLLFICYIDVWAAVVDIFICGGEKGEAPAPVYYLWPHYAGSQYSVNATKAGQVTPVSAATRGQKTL